MAWRYVTAFNLWSVDWLNFVVVDLRGLNESTITKLTGVYFHIYAIYVDLFIKSLNLAIDPESTYNVSFRSCKCPHSMQLIVFEFTFQLFTFC